MKGDPAKLKKHNCGYNPELLRVPQPQTCTILCNQGDTAAYLQRLGCTPREVEFYLRRSNPLEPAKMSITTEVTKQITIRFAGHTGNEVELEFAIG